jgi:hypothetical protein
LRVEIEVGGCIWWERWDGSRCRDALEHSSYWTPLSQVILV